ncbi:MAG: hypothetical protein QXJ32_02290 [Thermoplasmata archaeon]
MVGKWVKAAFLVILGIIVFYYADKLVEELRTTLEDRFEIAFEWVWDLLRILLWVLVAWLFVDAALVIALSFSEHRYSLSDVIKRLDRLEMSMAPGRQALTPSAPEEAEPVTAEPVEEEVPPPPGS